MSPAGRWFMWSAFVVCWTALLLLPGAAVEQLPTPEILQGRKFLLMKTGHVAGYAVLTVLSGWLQLAGRGRLLLLFFLMAHAAATEWIQEEWVPGRSGELRDVALDHLGVFIGLLLSWKWWTRPD